MNRLVAASDQRGALPVIMSIEQQGEQPFLNALGSPPAQPSSVIMNMAPADQQQRLLGEFDELESPPVVAQESRWSRWGGRIFSTLGGGACLAIRLLDYSRWTNAIGSFGTGFFTQAGVTSGFQGEDLARMRQLTFTLIGQTTLFALTQAFADPGVDYQAKTILAHIVIAELGANVQGVAKWLYDQRAVRLESHALATTAGDKFKQLSCIPQTLAHVLKLVAAGGCGVVYFLVDDAVVQGLASFGALFYTFQVIGERLIIWVDIKIAKHDSKGEELTIGARSGTCYRGMKTTLITVAYIAIPIAFIPFTANPDTGQRLRQLVYVGGSIGLFDGIKHKAAMARLENIPIRQLEEFRRFDSLRERKSKGQPEKCPLLRSLSDRVFGIAVPIISATGLVGFVIWQEGWKLDNRNAKISLGTMLAGFLVTSGLCGVVDWTWDPRRRHYIRDKLMAFLFASPRLFGINPLYIYLAGTNSLGMDSHAIASQESNFHVATIVISWGSYGFSMARELYVTSCNRIGSPIIKYPLMALANGFITAKLSISGAKISSTEVMP